jgi:hypothetical protein
MEKLRVVIPVVVASSLLTAALAFADTFADTMVITYRSGKVQNVLMEGPRADVSSVAYVCAPVRCTPERKVTAPPQAPAGQFKGAAGQLSGNVPEDRTDKGGSGALLNRLPEPPKPGFRIKWAPPVSE